MRNLNQTEADLFTKLQSRGKVNVGLSPALLQVEYHLQGNVTIAILAIRATIVGVGWSKFNCNDARFLPVVGEAIALSRALKQLNYD